MPDRHPPAAVPATILESALLEAVEQAVIATDLEGRITYWNRQAERTYGWRSEEVLGRQILDVTPSAASREQAAEILTCLQQGRRWAGEIQLSRRDGSEFPARVTNTPVLGPDGKLAGIVGISEDLSELRRAESLAREEAEVVDAINRVGQTIAAELDLQKVVQAVTDAATELTGARFGAFFYTLTDARGERMTLYTISGVPREEFERFGMPRNTQVFGPTFRAEGVVRSADITADPRYGHNRPHHGLPSGHLPVRSYLAVSVVSRSGEVIGGLFFGHPEAGVFTERAERLAEGLAGQAAVAVDNARLYRALQELNAALETRVEERTRELAAARTRAEVLAGLAEALQTAGSPADVAQIAAQHLGSALSADHIIAIGVERERLFGLTFWGDVPPSVRALLTGAGTTLERARVLGRVVREARAVYTMEYRDEPEATPFGDLPPRLSVGFEPVVDRSGTICAIFGVARDAAHGPWVDGDREILRRAAASIGLAIERAHARERLAEQATELEARHAELLRATRQATESEERFHALFDHSPEGIVLIDPHDPLVPWRILEANDAYSRMNGYEPGELAGRPIDVLHLENGSREERGRLLERLRRKGPFAFTTSHLRKDGLPITIEASAALVNLDGREVLLGVDRDISERDRQARELARANDDLEARNAEQETFVYTVSHDLRQPLLSLQGMSELLAEAVEAGDTEQARFAAGRVRANVGKMGALLDDLLALSRVGRSDAAPEPVDIGAAVATVLSDLEPRIRERGVALELPADWPQVMYPPTEAYQILLNLVGNAVKFAGRPGEPPRVVLSWEPEGTGVRLTVADNGPGVPLEHRERIFELFRKLDPTAAGTGVGLAIVRRIAERHAGRAWAEDSELGGARFVVTWPASTP